ncbi:hypothetical protein EBX31_02850 [bacterium]|nr:hypothetical protein [bacterium]
MLLSQKLPTSPRSSLHHSLLPLMAQKALATDTGTRLVELERCFSKQLVMVQLPRLEILLWIKPTAGISVFMLREK